MFKRAWTVMVTTLILGLIVFIGGGIFLSQNDRPSFAQAGYMLQPGPDGIKQLKFSADEAYQVSATGHVTFRDAEGKKTQVKQKSFLHLQNGAVVALSDGILLDFNDLSANFINNYYIGAGLEVTPSGNEYTAQSASGTITFGEHLWKLDDQTYLVQAAQIGVHFSQDDERIAEDYVQVSVTEDGIVQLLTQENEWNTISEECFIQTGSGVKIYPVSQLVENGTYKMSLAKLSVNADDSIVLTKEETRRQIVPELKINAVDGEDGTEGEAGQTGTDGTNGEEGSVGEEGSTGEDGTGGAGGKGGESGGNGSDGKDAVGESTVNSALPTMTIGAWQVSATGLKGAIAVTDENGYLVVDSTDSNDYMGRVTIYNAKTGEAIPCYQTNESYDEGGIEADEPGFSEFQQGQETIYFTTFGSPLQPDTSYRLSVTAYYKMDDTVYSREFISRIFYTDSTGVNLQYASASTDTLQLKANLAQAYQQAVVSAEVVLLTPAQNKGFTLASANSPANFTQKIILNYKEGKMTRVSLDDPAETIPGAPSYDQLIELTKLQPNTNYIARVIVHTESGLNTLTNQELALITLKQPPVWSGVPTANYNRVTGAFEVYRPAVTDAQGGIQKYIYTAYSVDGKALQGHTIAANSGDPVSFYLPSGAYTFGIKAEFDDNEKIVVYDLGKSTPVRAEGDTLPLLTFAQEQSGGSQEYNQIKGKLTIHLTGASTSLAVAQDKPLELAVYADQVYNQTIVIKDNNTVSQVDKYTATLNTNDRNYAQVDLALVNLYKNTNYTLTVTGYLDLGDGNGLVKRVIGTVSFRTYNTIDLVATWNDSAQSTGAISKTLKLSSQDTDKDRVDYALAQLQKGQLTLELYSGTGVGKVRIAYTDLSDPTKLSQAFGDGYSISEADFGNLTLNPASDYTLTVNRVMDGTYKLGFGYINTFDTVRNSSLPIVAQSTPPALLTEPTQGVTVTPVYNHEAALYGAVPDKELADEALIGYKLQANYDNVQRLGYSVTYYAMEYSEYYNALIGKTDPIRGGGNQAGITKLMEMTQRISENSDTVPSVAVLFGGTKTAADSDAKYANGCYVYYAGEAQLAGSLQAGMERGFRYVFAYTAKYSLTGSFDESNLALYPYSHPSYDGSRENYKAVYGAGMQYGKPLGRGVAYILNSGLWEAPRRDPEIHSYVYEAKGTEAKLVSSGSITIRYKYKDTDHTIKDTGAAADQTQVEFTNEQGGVHSQAITGNPVGNDWHEFKVPYVVSEKEGEEATLIDPVITIARYRLDYSAIMEELLRGTAYETTDSSEFYLCRMPVEWAWGMQFQETNYKDAVLLERSDEFLAENYILFRLVSNSVGSVAAEDLANRAYALKLVFTAGGETLAPIYLPVSTDYIGPYARLATGQLAKILGKKYTIKATILYDNGDQGWNLLADKDAFFALQYINGSGDRKGVFGFENYYSAVAGGSSITPSSALVQQTSHLISPALLEDTLNNLLDPQKVQGRFKYLTTGSGDLLRYFYVDHFGVDVSADSDVKQLTGRYVVPKGASEYALAFINNGETGVLEQLTPSIDMGTYRATTEAVQIGADFTVNGWNQADQESGDYQVYATVYDNQDDAKKLSPTSGVHGTVQFKLDANGKPTSDGAVSGLEKDGTYYLALWMKIKGQPTLLIDSKTAQQAIYRFTTIKGVGLSSEQGMVYYNEGYFDKTFQMTFSVTQYLGFTIQYDVFETEQAAQNDGTPVLSNQTLIDRGLLTAPSTLAQTRNTLLLNLEPSQARKELKPGQTYYVRLLVKESSGTPVGTGVWPFTLPAVTNYGALVYAQNATTDSITFQVTLNDLQNSYMGRKNEKGVQTDSGALYAVRFTTEDGYRLKTVYDDRVWPGQAVQQKFVLSNDTLTLSGSVTEQRIKANTTYQIHIYAIVDEDHDGLSMPVSTGGPGQDWKYFFPGLNDAAQQDAAPFLNLVDSFWTIDYQNAPAMDQIEKGFQIAMKTQKTTDSSGVLINDKTGASLTRIGTNRLQLVLAESYGIISESNKQAFERIDWSVNGYTTGNKPVTMSGSSLLSNSDTLFVKSKDAAGYDIYSYTIPTDILSGSYSVVMQLYRKENDQAPYETALSFSYRG